MEYVEVQGEKIPSLGFGTWRLNGEKCLESVKDALKIGYRHIDTAQSYGNERMVGEAIKESKVSRDDIWLTTKIWRTNLRHDQVITSFQESLEKLQTSYVDLLLIHWPNKEVPFGETLKAMSELVEAGKVKNIGVSNFTTGQIESAWSSSPKPILTDQVEYHPFLSQDKVLEKCREQDMMLTAYSPLARGEVMDSTKLEEIGEKYGKTEAQVALRWLIEQENVSTIPKASSKSHRRENFNIFDFELTQNE